MVSYFGSGKEDVSDLIRKLENPLGFIGESRLSHVCFRDRWTAINELMEKARSSPRSKDNVMSGLRERLSAIKSELRGSGMSIHEARPLFEEGIAVKHALYVLGNNVREEDDRHADTRRWIDFGKRMRK